MKRSGVVTAEVYIIVLGKERERGGVLRCCNSGFLRRDSRGCSDVNCGYLYEELSIHIVCRLGLQTHSNLFSLLCIIYIYDFFLLSKC